MSFQAVHQPLELMSDTLRNDDTNSPNVGTVHTTTISHITQDGAVAAKRRKRSPVGAIIVCEAGVAGAVMPDPSSSAMWARSCQILLQAADVVDHHRQHQRQQHHRESAA